MIPTLELAWRSVAVDLGDASVGKESDVCVEWGGRRDRMTERPAADTPFPPDPGHDPALGGLRHGQETCLRALCFRTDPFLHVLAKVLPDRSESPEIVRAAMSRRRFAWLDGALQANRQARSDGRGSPGDAARASPGAKSATAMASPNHTRQLIAPMQAPSPARLFRNAPAQRRRRQASTAPATR